MQMNSPLKMKNFGFLKTYGNQGNQLEEIRYINPAYPMIIVHKDNGSVEELSTGDMDRLKIF